MNAILNMQIHGLDDFLQDRVEDAHLDSQLKVPWKPSKVGAHHSQKWRKHFTPYAFSSLSQLTQKGQN